MTCGPLNHNVVIVGSGCGRIAIHAHNKPAALGIWQKFTWNHVRQWGAQNTLGPKILYGCAIAIDAHPQTARFRVAEVRFVHYFVGKHYHTAVRQYQR